MDGPPPKHKSTETSWNLQQFTFIASQILPRDKNLEK